MLSTYPSLNTFLKMEVSANTLWWLPSSSISVDVVANCESVLMLARPFSVSNIDSMEETEQSGEIEFEDSYNDIFTTNIKVTINAQQ